MSEDILQVHSLTQLHDLLGFEKPKHPLISVIDVSKLRITEDMVNVKVSTALYYVALKSKDCGMVYGRNAYDFEEGVLAFAAPQQVIMAREVAEFDQDEGWMLFFHPDLFRSLPLGESIEHFSFFSYDTHEALHVSEVEKQTLRNCINMIRDEYEQRIDAHSQKVLVSSLELLLSYCQRFYERQFNTRSTANKAIVTKVEGVLKHYYESGMLTETGLPTLQYLAAEVHLSQNYLSDLLKKETGRSAKEHINDFVVDKAKRVLLVTDHSVAQIAYELGFNYPHYFSRLFKSKTGMSPIQYRSSHLD